MCLPLVPLCRRLTRTFLLVSRGYHSLNIKQAAKTLNFLTEHGIDTYPDLESRVAEITAASDEAAAVLKAAEQRLADMGITDLGEIISMWAERTWYDIKAGFRQLVRDFFELLFNAAGLTIDTLRTFFLVVLSILGPLSFALSIYDGFHSTLASWISRYISVYLWLPIADLFSAVLAKIQTLMLQADVLALQDPNYIPDSGSGVYIIFLIIGIIGYFTIPTVAEWVIQSGGAGGAMGGINKAGAFATGVAGGIAGNMIGRTFGRRGGGGSSSGNGGGGPASGSAPNGRNLATQGNSNHS